MHGTSAKQSQFSDCGLGMDLLRDAGLAACRLGPARGGCTNKPNLPPVTRAIVRHRLDAPFRETKPIPGRAGWDEGQMRKTDPISGGRDIPPFQPDANCATSPRCPASGNEPNFASRDEGGGAWDDGANYAKQSQTWAGWGIWGTAHGRSRLCKTKPIWWGQMCKTNPICLVGCGRGGRNMQNEPNLPAGGSAEPPPAAIMQNEPNFRRRDRSCETNPIMQNKPNWEGRPCKTKPICPTSTRAAGRGDSAKQSQFPHGPYRARAGDAVGIITQLRKTKPIFGRQADAREVGFAPAGRTHRFSRQPLIIA
jgi:hypothetical protein